MKLHSILHKKRSSGREKNGITCTCMQLSALETAQSSKNKQKTSSVATKKYDLRFSDS